jgi:hypothetical protein
MFNYVVSSADVRMVLYGMGDNYIYQESSQYSIGLWNVHDIIIECPLFFLPILTFRHLKDHHEFQHEKIDKKLLQLFNKYVNGELTPTELAILDQAKQSRLKKEFFHVNCVFSAKYILTSSLPRSKNLTKDTIRFRRSLSVGFDRPLKSATGTNLL